MKATTKMTQRAVMTCLIALTCVFSVLLVVPASAQECYPSGCTPPTNPGSTTTTAPNTSGSTTTTAPNTSSSTTTTAPPADGPSCGVSLSTGQVGSTVTASVTNVPAGGAVKILFDGVEVANSADGDQQATGSAGGPVLLRSAPAKATQAPSLTVTLTFQVPDVPPGNYSVVAVGDTFTVSCGAGDGSTGFQVLAADDSTGSPIGSGRGPLAFTGASIVGLIVVAAVLLAAGWLLVAATRRRRAARV